MPRRKTHSGEEDTLAEGISRWLEDQVEQNVEHLTGEKSLTFHGVGQRGKNPFALVLQPQLSQERLDHTVWSLMKRT